MKMLTTQVSGLLQRIVGNNEASIEETARLLAQATVGEGRIIIASFGDMDVVRLVAARSKGSFSQIIHYEDDMQIGTEDRVWILTHSGEDGPALELAQVLAKNFIPFAVVATEKAVDNELAGLATTYISTGLTKGLLPGEDGERYVEPHAITALFIYEAVKISYDEMMDDQ